MFRLLERALAEVPAAAVTEEELNARARALAAKIGNAVDVAHYGNEQRELLRRSLADMLIMEYGLKMAAAMSLADDLVSLAARSREWFVRLVGS